MKQDTEGVHFHNSLWASAFAGVSGTAMFWWWDMLDRQEAYSHYRPLAAFFSDVSLAGLRSIQATSADGLYRWLGHQSQDRAYLWIANSQATWWNRVIEKKRPAPVEGATITLRQLLPGDYHLEWWDTYEGGRIRNEKVTFAQAPLSILVPSFSRDIACKIWKTTK